MAKHLLFYDGECGLCDRAVQFVLKRDDKRDFVFAPLQGETAARELAGMSELVESLDTLILIEFYRTDRRRVLTYGKGALKIAWHLGGVWSVLGFLSFLPAAMFNVGYRFVARNRHRLFTQACMIPDPSHRDRFLP